LCDEPLSNLDADLRERMRVEISALVRESGATAIYITHDQAEAFALADQVGVLQNGRLIQFGKPEQVYTEPASPFVARFTGLSGELPVRVVSQAGAGPDGVTEVELAGPALLRGCRVRTSSPFAPGSPAILQIRPTEHHLAGVVADVAFRGRGYEHAIDIAGHGRLTGIFAPARADRGTSVGLRLDPAGCHVFATGSSAD
jgi:iron(III) transport system ATP-binding protein